MKGTYNIPNYLVTLAKQKDKEQTNEKKTKWEKKTKEKKTDDETNE